MNGSDCLPNSKLNLMLLVRRRRKIRGSLQLTSKEPII